MHPTCQVVSTITVFRRLGLLQRIKDSDWIHSPFGMSLMLALSSKSISTFVASTTRMSLHMQEVKGALCLT